MNSWPLFGKPVDDSVKANDLVWMEIFFQNAPSTKHLLRRIDVEKMVKAYKNLHYAPGINPHNGAITSKIFKITMAPLVLKEDYWWTKPNLDTIPNEEGAHMIEDGYQITLWEDRPYIIELCKNEPD